MWCALEGCLKSALFRSLLRGILYSFAPRNRNSTEQHSQLLASFTVTLVEGFPVKICAMHLLLSCLLFAAVAPQHGIIGLKSGVTRRWLGQTFLGYLRVSGTSFGKNYEWQVRFHHSGSCRSVTLHVFFIAVSVKWLRSTREV